MNTETPTEVNWMTGISLQATVPKIHSSTKYLKASTGTQVTSSKRSPAARLEMKILGTLLMALLVMNIFTRVMFPSNPTEMMIMYIDGITHRMTNSIVSLSSGAASSVKFGKTDEFNDTDDKLLRNSSMAMRMLNGYVGKALFRVIILNHVGVVLRYLHAVALSLVSASV